VTVVFWPKTVGQQAQVRRQRFKAARIVFKLFIIVTFAVYQQLKAIKTCNDHLAVVVTRDERTLD